MILGPRNKFEKTGVRTNATLPARIRKAPNPRTQRHYIVTNPYDLAPADDIIWKAVQEEYAALPPDQTLVIIIGERHDSPANIMTQISLLSHLARWRDESSIAGDPANRFIFSYEYSYSNLVARLKKMGVTLPTDNFPEKLEGYHKNMHGVLADVFRKHILTASGLSRRSLWNACKDLDVPVCLSDTDSTFDAKATFLLPTPYALRIPFNPLADQIAQDEYNIDLATTSIPIFSTTGMGIRNAMMVQRTLAFAKASGQARIAVQHCGAYHMYGYRTRKSIASYDESLTGRFNKAGCRTLGITLNYDSTRPKMTIADEALHKNPHHLIIEGLADDSFILSNNPFKIALHTLMQYLLPGLLAEKDESRFLQKLADSYGGASCPFKDYTTVTVKELRQYAKKVRREARQQTSRMIPSP